MIQDKENDFTVIVVTYNTVPEKLWITLKSIINQKKVTFDIIISDDGSKNNLHDEIIYFMEQRKFFNFKIIPHEQNQGTVLNVYDAVKASRGNFIKIISPGDFLTNDTVLHDWLKHILNSGCKWSFGDAIYYADNGNFKAVPKKMNPQIIEPYIKKDIPKCRWNYLVLDDIALGSAIICQRELLIGYLEMIANKVIYAEDNIYRLMMFDGVAADYYPDKVLFYECGVGISTSGDSKWDKLLKKDWTVSTQIMLSRSDYNDVFQSKIADLMLKKWLNNHILRCVFKINVSGWLRYRLKKKFMPRMSSVRDEIVFREKK